MTHEEIEAEVYKLVSEVMKLHGTKSSPEMVSAISELLTSLKPIFSD
ncbi:hypothetical protein OfM1_21660 [Lactovum odontotermitis]